MPFDLRLFINRYAWLTLLCILTQQTLVASATYFLTRLMQAFQSGLPIQTWLYAYCLAMLAPYIPGCLGHISLQHWINRTHADYVARALKTMRRWRGKQVSHHDREFTQTLVGKQSLTLIEDVLYFGHGFVDFLASSLLNIIVLAWLLPGDLALGYAVSAVACTFTLFLLRGPIDRLATRQENNHIDFAAHLTRAWDNTVIGNVYNHARWNETNQSTASRYYASVIRLKTVSWLGNILLSVLTLVPSIYLIVSTLNDPSLLPVVAAALIANLTRIFHVLSGVTALVGQAITCGATFARARVLFDGWPTTNELDNADAREAAMKMPLSINDETVASRDDALAMLAQKRSGRFTIRAPNGAGKSTFLRALKFTVGDGAFYLPAHTEGLAWEADLNGLSTGQKMVSHLNEVETLTAITHILLDEWDANLDQANTALFDRRLNASAQSRVIVEIRH